MADELLIDSGSPDFQRNPYQLYRRLREVAPAVQAVVDGDRHWVIARYEEALAALRDARLGREPERPERQAALVERLTYAHSMLNRDPPTQTRLRRAASGPFRPQAIAAMRQKVETLVNSLIDSMADRGEADFKRDFADPLTVGFLCTFTGLPERISRPVMQAQTSPESVLKSGALVEYKIAERRKSGAQRDDFLGALLASRAAGEFLSDEEVVAAHLVILAAGQHTTSSLLANGLACLLSNPEQLRSLRTTPEMIKPAIEEMLRYESPVQATFRRTKEPVRVGGVVIPRDSQVLLLFGAANRDPAQFPSADEFLVERVPNRHLGMGAGAHLCIGAGLARLVAEVTFRRLLDRFKSIDLTEESEQRWEGGLTFRGITNLRIRVDPG